jgi:hypothetical protein
MGLFRKGAVFCYSFLRLFRVRASPQFFTPRAGLETHHHQAGSETGAALLAAQGTNAGGMTAWKQGIKAQYKTRKWPPAMLSKPRFNLFYIFDR